MNIFILILIFQVSHTMTALRKYIDIGANLVDPMFQGIYHGSKKHESDLLQVIERAKNIGINKIIITGTDLEDSKEAIKLSEKDDILFSTVGCHPTRCDEFEKSGDSNLYLKSLEQLTKEKKVVAIGECGLDYDRLNFCQKHVQKKYFQEQLQLSQTTGLPLFLHCRNAADDLIEIFTQQNYRYRGVVHSFTESLQQMNRLVDLGFYIGVNGCSLKTEDNLLVAKSVPLDRLLIETDSPWCEIRPSHAGFKYVKSKFNNTVKKEKWISGSLVKGRNEPSMIVQIFEVLSAIREENEDEMWKQIHDNTEKLFFSER